jgi:uncharacterized Tic20 family protein
VSDAFQTPQEPIYPELTSEAKNWGMLCHLSALAGLLVPGLAMFVGPLLIWLIKGKDHPFIDDQGKESLNFQISMLVYFIVSCVLICVLIGIVLAPVVFLTNIILVIVASMKASGGEAYRYPLTIRLIK